MKLPLPDPDAQGISAQLQALIAAEIAVQGPMPFQRFMELALYAPGLGYYAAGSHKFGAAGDFVTAPELGEVWAQCVAQAIAGLLRTCRSPVVMELGAGSGALAVDLLTALRACGSLPSRYLILERSADLRERQRQRLLADVPDLMARIEWLDAPPEQTFDGAIIGNEVVDALPCARFVVTQSGVREIAVEYRDGQWVETQIAPSALVIDAVERLQRDLRQDLPSGYTSELNPELPAWFSAISAPLRRGLVLLADYGYGRPEYYAKARHEGTLICHYRHHAHTDPYWFPGLNDISASVDFTALAEAGTASGCELLSYDSQTGFLLGLGLEQLFGHLEKLDERTRLRISGQLKQLMLPGMMGERFKLMLFGRAVEAHLLPPGLCGDGQRRML